MLLPFACTQGLAQHATATPASNRALLDTCFARLSSFIAARLPAGSITLTVDSSREATLLAASLFRTLGRRMMDSGTTDLRVQARVEDASTRYERLAERVARRVGVRLTVACTDTRSGAVRWAATPTELVTDTIACDEIAGVDSPTMAAAHAPDPCAPDASLFDTLLEPLVLVAASATIVILLFAVRGQ